jgi:LEA14-like dessication related protein
MKRALIRITIVVVILAGLTGCAVMEQIQQRLAIQNCKFRLDNVRAHGFSLTDMEVELDIGVTNPNPISVIIDKLDLLLFINNRETLSANFGGRTINTNENIILTTSLRIPYLKVGMAIIDIIKRKEKVNYKLEGGVYINSAYGSFRFPVTIYKSQ